MLWVTTIASRDGTESLGPMHHLNRFCFLDSFEALEARLVCVYICKPHILLGHGPNYFQTCIFVYPASSPLWFRCTHEL